MTRRQRRKQLRLKVKAIFGIAKELLIKTNFENLVPFNKQGTKEEIAAAIIANMNVLKPVIDKLFDGLIKLNFRNSEYVLQSKFLLDDLLEDGKIDNDELIQFSNSLAQVLSTIDDALSLLNAFIANEKISDALDALCDTIEHIQEMIEFLYEEKGLN